MNKIPLIDGEEQDVFTNWRKILSWHKGEIKKVKRKYNKRTRRKWKEEIRRTPLEDL